MDAESAIVAGLAPRARRGSRAESDASARGAAPMSGIGVGTGCTVSRATVFCAPITRPMVRAAPC